MHRRHPDEGLLSFGDAIARNILQRGRIGKLFVPAQDRIWASINTPVPLALLHLKARKKNLPPNALPAPFPDRGFLHAKFKGVSSSNWGRTYDYFVFYLRTRDEPTVTRQRSSRVRWDATVAPPSP
jgi:hypothetical protein